MTGEIYMEVTLNKKDGTIMKVVIEYRAQGVPTAVVHQGKVFMRADYGNYVEVSSTDIVEAG